MKYAVIVILALLLVVPLALAEQTSGATYTSPNGCVPDPFIDALNDQEFIDHTHQIDVDDRENPVGVGADVTVWENDDAESKVEGVEIQTKHDFVNGETSVFAVLQLNFSSFFKEKEVE